MKINIQAIINDSTKAQLQGLVSRGIKEAELDDNGHLIFTLTDNSTVDIGRVEGDPGEDGASIVAITKGQTVGDTTTYIITMSDGNEFEFEVKTAKGDPGEPGADGVGVQSATINGSGHLILTLTDGTVIDCGNAKGAKGDTGATGAAGADGTDGVSITNITKTGTSGKVDTYTITLSNGTTKTFTVTNGSDGSNGSDGEDGISVTGASINASGHLIITLSNGTTVDAGNAKGAKGDTGSPGQNGAPGADGLTTSVTVNGETITQSDGNIDIGSPTRIKINGVEQTVDADGYADIPIASSATLGVLKFASADGFVASSSGNLRASERTLSQYTSAAGTLNIGKGTLENIKTDLVNRALLGNVKSAMDAVAAVNTMYFLGTQSSVSIVLPTNASPGQQISAVWYNGATAATLSITGTVLTVDYTPSANSRSEINALWDGTYWAVVTNEQAVST